MFPSFQRPPQRSPQIERPRLWIEARTIQVKVDNKQTQCVNPPTVFIQKPEDDAYRFGQVTIEAEASAGGDVAAIVQVLFSVDGSSIGKAEVSPWAAQWDSDKASEGPHTIKAIAKDNFDKLGVHQITVTVDRTPPSVAFAAPDSGAVVNGDAQPVTVAVDAADNLALPGVTFSAKGPGGAATDLGGVKQKPWQVLWPTTGEPSGTWTLLATATDAAGHTAQATRDVVLDRPPTLAFSDPTPGATLAGEVGVELLAQDDLGLQGSVTLRLDGTKVANLQPGSAGSGGKYLLSWLWDTTQAAFGEHLLEAEVADLSGNKATASAKVSVDQSLAVGVLVCNASFGGCKAPAGDPSTEYTGKVYLLATADDDNATVQKGELLLDGKGLQSLAAAPWQFTWDSASIKDGAHELAIKVTTSLPQSKTVAFGFTVNNCDLDHDEHLALGAGCGGDDCNDMDQDFHPGAVDLYGDVTDSNCDGVDGVDADGDKVASLASGGKDCDDGDKTGADPRTGAPPFRAPPPDPAMILRT